MQIEAFQQIKPQKLTDAELESLAQLDVPLLNQLAALVNKRLSCAQCNGCSLRCEVLQESSLTIGSVGEGFQKILALPPKERPKATLQLKEEQPYLYRALRRCCFCGHCTAECQAHMLGADRMREWRSLFMQAGLMTPTGYKLLLVDNEWNIFSAYRAIFGIEYPEFLPLSDAALLGPGVVDTLFFPGCSLVSYAPELTRKVALWLGSVGVDFAMSDACCGSPLMSIGSVERAESLRQKIFDQIRAAGITKILTICPGCSEEFAEIAGGEIEIIPLPEFLLEKSNVLTLEDGFRLGFGDGSDAEDAWNPSSVTFFDSCHDRSNNRYGDAARKLVQSRFPQTDQLEMKHNRNDTLCCGAGGAVTAFDNDLSQRRAWRVIDEARETGAETMVTMCPTCTYTFANVCSKAEPGKGINNHHYLELIFEQKIDWPAHFAQLESMWTGEYAHWLTETFLT